jgi:hypothetical protein
MRSPRRSAAAVPVLLFLIACTQTPSTPTASPGAATEATIPFAPGAGPAGLEPRGTVTSMALSGSWTAGGITGEIRITPYPVEGDVPLHVNVNLCHPNATGLQYRVSWGEGAPEGSGFCRFEHTYSKAGNFPIEVCVWDRVPASFPGSCSTFTARSIAPPPASPSPAAPSPSPSPSAPTYCHSVTATTWVPYNGVPTACPTGATSWCDTVPIGPSNHRQAQKACEACFGAGQCMDGGSVWVSTSGAVAGMYWSSRGMCGTIGAGDITNTTVNCGVAAPGRWAP